MDLIATLEDTNFGFPKSAVKQFIKRQAARAVLVDDNKRICLAWAKNGNYYKLPGGGIDEGETKEQAMYREVREEVGYNCEIVAEIGQIRQLRSSNFGNAKVKDKGLDQISYCWLARTKEFVGANLMGDEIEDGFELKWFDDIDAAIEAVEKAEHKATESTSLETAMFFTTRELVFLREAKKLLAKM